jgi:hypothetical protein
MLERHAVQVITRTAPSSARGYRTDPPRLVTAMLLAERERRLATMIRRHWPRPL